MVNCKLIYASWVWELVNPFQANAPFLYSLETENLQYACVLQKINHKGKLYQGVGCMFEKVPIVAEKYIIN